MTTFKTLLAASAAIVAGAGAAAAAPAVALVGDATLVMFDTETLDVTGEAEVSGTGRLLGIDWRPANSTLVAVDADNIVYTIDPATGAATRLSEMNTPLPAEGAPVVVDFNPMADRLRFMSGTTNHRVNVDTGEVTVDGSLAFEGADMHAGEAPNIVAAAYINSNGKPEATAMYDVDATIGALIRQTSPNDGTLAAIGKFGVPTGDTFAFDVHTTADGTNTAYLVTQNVLHRVELETGKATAVGAIMEDGAVIDGTVRDVTVMPGM